MSLFTSSSSDMPWLGCRASRGSGATCSLWHVAFHKLVERHAMVGMSRLARIRSDMLALACRFSQARRATCHGWDVAPREDPERHARLRMSLRMRAKCDMDRALGSLDRSSKATFTLLHVAPRAWVGRHAAAPWATSERETVAFGSQATRPRETSGEPVSADVGTWGPASVSSRSCSTWGSPRAARCRARA